VEEKQMTFEKKIEKILLRMKEMGFEIHSCSSCGVLEGEVHDFHCSQVTATPQKPIHYRD
jgi:hypothetical protein